MNKKEFVTRVTEVLRENGTKKPISAKKHVFHISDNEGNNADFVVKQKNKSVIYTIDDTANIVDACLAVIEDALKSGEEINIHGFGCLGLHYRAARTTIDPYYGEPCEVEARYIPKFNYGKTLRMAARLYELSLKEAEHDILPPPMDDLEGGDV